MLKKSRFALGAVFLTAILLIASALLLSRPAETTGDSQWANSGKCDFLNNTLNNIPNNKYSVQGEIREFCEGLSDPLTLLGNPATNALTTPDGNTKQYFEHALVVVQKDNHVELLPLGELFWKEGGKFFRRTPVTMSSFAINTCKTINDIPVCNEFLDFYQHHKDFIGEPVGEAVWENDELVQYFRYARLVLRHGKVALSELGLWYFAYYEPNKTAFIDAPGNAAIQRKVTRLHIHADAYFPRITEKEEQTIRVQVLDQNNQPLYGATVSITIKTQDGKPIAIHKNTAETDADGFAKFTFEIPEFKSAEDEKNLVGNAIVYVTADYQGTQAESQTSFFIWH